MNNDDLRAKCSLCSNYINPPFARDGYCTFLLASDNEDICRYQGQLEIWGIKKGLISFDAVMYRCKRFKEVIDTT